MLITVFEVICAFGVSLTACELCQQNYQAYDDCSNMIQKFDWYVFPIEVQRMMPAILNFTQQPVEIKCLGSMACNRETFKYVSTAKLSQTISPFSNFMYSVTATFLD